MKKNKTKFDFKKTFERLEEIAKWFENDDIDINEGIEKFKEGTELIKQAQENLKEVENILKKVNK